MSEPLDLTHFKKAVADMNGKGAVKLNDYGKMNLACWIGERAHLLVAEIERLRAAAEKHLCPYCETEMVEGEAEYDQDGYSSVTWDCPKCGGKVAIAHIPPYEQEDDG